MTEQVSKIRGKVIKEEVVDGIRVVYVYKRYESAIEGYKRYREKNAETIKQQQREYFKTKWDTDEEYRNKKREANRLRSQKKRQEMIEAGLIIPQKRGRKPSVSTEEDTP